MELYLHSSYTFVAWTGTFLDLRCSGMLRSLCLWLLATFLDGQSVFSSRVKRSETGAAPIGCPETSVNK
jgi:hypothetical protein